MMIKCGAQLLSRARVSQMVFFVVVFVGFAGSAWSLALSTLYLPGGIPSGVEKMPGGLLNLTQANSQCDRTVSDKDWTLRIYDEPANEEFPIAGLRLAASLKDALNVEVPGPNGEPIKLVFRVATREQGYTDFGFPLEKWKHWSGLVLENPKEFGNVKHSIRLEIESSFGTRSGKIELLSGQREVNLFPNFSMREEAQRSAFGWDEDTRTSLVDPVLVRIRLKTELSEDEIEFDPAGFFNVVKNNEQYVFEVSRRIDSLFCLRNRKKVDDNKVATEGVEEGKQVSSSNEMGEVSSPPNIEDVGNNNPSSVGGSDEGRRTKLSMDCQKSASPEFVSNFSELERDPSYAIDVCARVLKLGVVDPDVKAWLGRAYDAAGQTDRSFELYSESSKAGSSFGMNGLGSAYYLARGTRADFPLACGWYRRSADLGNRKAMRNLANCYREGLGVVRDLEEASNWERTAEQLPEGSEIVNGFKTYKVDRSVSEGYANVRSGPGTGNEVLFRITAGEGGVYLTGPCRRPEAGGGKRDWCPISWRGNVGWISITALR